MALSASRLVSVTGFKVDMVRWAVVPVFAAILSTAFSSLVLKNVLKTETAPGLVLTVLFMAAIYYFLLRIFRCIKKSDILLAKRIFEK
jgi:hypothetical protein